METVEEKIPQESNDKAIFSDGKKIRTWSSALALTTALIGMIASLITLFSNPEGKRYIQKATIKEIMRNTIKNRGDLDIIKHIYNTRESKNLFWLFSDSKEKYYSYDYPLSGILNDLKVDYLQDSKDSLYFVALCNIISQNEKQNPFDNLEDNQKYSFENILVKMDTSYITIKPDVVKIAEELNNKNQLVNKYLNKSDLSYRISIIALFVTIVLSLFQIYQNSSTSKDIRKVFNLTKEENYDTATNRKPS